MSLVRGKRLLRGTAVSAMLIAVAACGPTNRNVPLVEGPAVEDIVTPYEDALMCLNGKIDTRLSFGVGGIPDQTGKEQNSTEGAGRFVTQGAGDIVQSALFKSGVTVINRRDMGSAAMESQWGIRDLTSQRQANLVITGSINSLDFIPGGGAFLNVSGVGPRYRQHRILVGMDLALTNNNTGQVLANIALHKQLFADELGFAGTRFVGDRLVDSDVGIARREAVRYALRQMLQLATFELLVQLMPPAQYADCAEMIDPRHGRVRGGRTSGEQLRQHEERLAAQEARAAARQAAAEEQAAVTEAVLADEQAAADAAPDAAQDVQHAAPASAPPPASAAQPQVHQAAPAPAVQPAPPVQQAAPAPAAQPVAPAVQQAAPAQPVAPPQEDSATSESAVDQTEVPRFPVGEPVPDGAPMQIDPGFHTGDTDLADTPAAGSQAPEADIAAVLRNAANASGAEERAELGTLPGNVPEGPAQRVVDMRLHDADCEEFPNRAAAAGTGCQLADVPRHLALGGASAR